MSDTVALATEFGASRKAKKNKKQTKRTNGETSEERMMRKTKARESREEQGLIKLGSVNPTYGMIPKNAYPFFEVRPRFATERIEILNVLMGLALATTITEFKEDGDEWNMQFIRTMKAKAKEEEKKRKET
jgi:IMP dehydrogenase/GMP reductase